MSHAYEWSVLRVVPRVERGECVNVGVVVYSRAANYLAAQVTEDLTRAQALDPSLDVVAVRQHLDWVRALCAGSATAGQSGKRAAGDRFRWLVSPRSTVVQTSPAHPGLAPDPSAVLPELFARMVEPVPDRG